MNLHEYQSKELFAEYGIPVPEGRPARSPEEAVEAAQSLGGSLWVVKAQVHAGGRGKAGGVQLARSLDDVRRHAQALLGGRLVTHQSGPEGLPVEVVYVEAGSEIDRELYLSLLVDRASGRIAFIASAAGGMDIEQVAAETPEKIVTVTISPAAGVQDFQVRRLASALKLGKEQGKPFAELVRRLYRLYTECDASLVEINPLIVTKAG
ncbi:MAG TPA: ATP-grasp domain-containing protein, partial [Woeseiaceae bacterium]|nr:ATP-grasp domain-containing protein [Woeseiaceae bacterium]